MDHTKGDRLWLVFTASFNWDPTDGNHCFNHTLLTAGTYGPTAPPIPPYYAYGPYTPTKAGKVMFIVPDLAAKNDSEHPHHESQGGHKVSGTQHTITVS